MNRDVAKRRRRKGAGSENDEAIAHALQEEFRKVAAAETTGSSDDRAKKLQESVLEQNWSTIAKTGKTFGGHSRAPKIADNSNFDREVRKKLNGMAGSPHKPRINGKIPSEKQKKSDREKLKERLETFDLFELEVQGDGNCQFRALSEQIYGKEDYHEFVRQEIVDQLKSHPELYMDYVPNPPMSYHEYVEKMKKCGEWGDHVTLQAAADKYGFMIHVFTSFEEEYINIPPKKKGSKKVIYLSYYAEVHYNSVHPRQSEFPVA